MGPDRLVHAPDHLVRIHIGSAFHNLQEPVVPERDMIGILRLVQSVGIDQQRDAADILQHMARENVARSDSKRHVGFPFEERGFPVGTKERGRIVTAVAETHFPGFQVDDSDEHGDEHQLLVIRGEGFIQFPRDFRDGRSLLNGHAKDRARHGHQQTRRDSLSTHVTDAEVQLPVLNGKVIQVSAHLFRRNHLTGHVDPYLDRRGHLSIDIDVHLLRELPGNQAPLDIPRHLELALDALPFGRRTLEFVDIRDQGRLHVGEGTVQGADFVLAGRFRKDRIKMAAGDVPGLDGQVAERFEGLPDHPEAYEEHQDQPQETDAENDHPEPLEGSENIPFRAHDPHAPARGFERGVEDVASLPVDLEGPHPLFKIHHGPSQGFHGRRLTGQGFRENGLIEEYVRIGMHEESSAPAQKDDVGVRIRLDGGERLRQPLEGDVQGDGADIGAVSCGKGLAVGDEHLVLQVRVVILLPVAVRLGPAGLVQQFGKLVPAQVPVLVIVAAFLDGRDGIALHPA